MKEARNREIEISVYYNSAGKRTGARLDKTRDDAISERHLGRKRDIYIYNSRVEKSEDYSAPIVVESFISRETIESRCP